MLSLDGIAIKPFTRNYGMFGKFVKEFQANLDTNKLSSAGFWLDSVDNEPNFEKDVTPTPYTYGEREFQQTKKSLLIGINYTGQKGELKGCVKDVELMKEWIMERGFSDDESLMFVLTEENENTPTKENILHFFECLVEDAQPGDDYFFHFSGHGVRVPNTEGDDSDSYDEALCPVDYKTAGFITEETINQYLIQYLPKDCRLTVVFDCCHSGSPFQLPYTLKFNDHNVKHLPDECVRMTANNLWELKLFNGILKQNSDFGNRIYDAYKIGKKDQQCEFVREGSKECLAEIIMFSGYRDDLATSDLCDPENLDVECEAGVQGGACVNALAEVLKDGQDLSYIEAMEKMHDYCKRKGYKQRIQLSSSVEIPMDATFTIAN